MPKDVHEEPGGEGREEGAGRGEDVASELERSLRSLGAALETVGGKLLGARVVGKEVPPDRVAISPEADDALVRAGESVGRLLHAAGEGLKAHPLRPDAAFQVARDHAEDDLHPREGYTPLTTGLVDLGAGLAKVAEGVLDVVAPRRPKPPADAGAEAEGPEAATPVDEPEAEVPADTSCEDDAEEIPT